jgi:hypothetical protein
MKDVLRVHRHEFRPRLQLPGMAPKSASSRAQGSVTYSRAAFPAFAAASKNLMLSSWLTGGIDGSAKDYCLRQLDTAATISSWLAH